MRFAACMVVGCWLVVLGLGGTTPRAEAQLAERMLDLLPDESSRGSEPGGFARLADRRVVFNTSNLGLWTTDGTSVGTTSLKKACPDCQFGGELARLPGRSLFLSTELSRIAGVFYQLWSSDGTVAGTFRLPIASTVFPFVGGSNNVAVLDGVAYFGWQNLGSSTTLWQTDGTVAGTRSSELGFGSCSFDAPHDLRTAPGRLFVVSRSGAGCAPEIWQIASGGQPRVIVPATLGPVFNNPNGYAAGDSLLFYATTGSQGSGRLWSIARPGARPADLLPGNVSLLGQVGVVGDNLYFVAFDARNGEELWVSDGSRRGTRRLSRFDAASPLFRFAPGQLGAAGATVWFATSDQDGRKLYRLDPRRTEPVRVPLRCAGDTEEASVEFVAPNFYAAGEKLFATVRCSAFETLFVLDEAGGATDLRELCPGGCGAVETRTTAVIGDEVFVFAADRRGQHQVWQSDGTGAGTRVLTALKDARGPLSPAAAWISPIAGGWVFAANTDETGTEPYFTSGQPASTRLLLDIGRSLPGSKPRGLAALGDKLLFGAELDGFSLAPSLLATDEGSRTAIPLTDPAWGGDGVPRAVVAGGKHYAVRRTDLDFYELWVSDGTEAGTQLLLGAGGGTFFGTSTIPGLAVRGDEVFFTVDVTGKRGLWQTDGTAQGTTRLVALEGENDLRIGAPVADGDAVYYLGWSQPAIRTLWRLGSGASTPEAVILTAERGQGDGAVRTLGELAGDTLLFLCDSVATSVYRTDGSAAGTVELLGPEQALAGSELNCATLDEPALPVPGGAVFLAARPFTQGIALYRTDGTPEGTVPVFLPSEFYSNPGPIDDVMEAFGGSIFVALDGGATGLELWQTDGTAEGTVPWLDLRPGEGSADPRQLTNLGDRLVFTAHDGFHGYELFASDGTTAGTRLLHDLYPGFLSSSPAELTVVGERLYFVADDGLSGRELFSLPLDPGPACRPGATALCLGDGRFRLEAEWRDFRGRTGLGQSAPLTSNTGSFWFFNQANTEVVAKVLDGRANNSHYWTFYGALSNVEYWLTVADAETGLTRRYFNPSGTFASVGDTRSFGPLGASLEWSPGLVEAAAGPPPVTLASHTAALAEACAPTPNRLCLSGGRFAVDASFRDFQGRPGIGKAVPVSGDTGYFWFFDDTNVETIVKVLDGRANNGNFWVFFGALSNVDYDLTVTDTLTGEVKTYQNRNRTFASVGDTRAFLGS